MPGNVLRCFRPSSSVQAVSGAEDISKYIWNKVSGTKTYDTDAAKPDIWSVLSPEAVEEIVLLCIQMEKGYYIYSSTVKYAFPGYECQMVNKDGKHAYPQVKSGDVQLKADDYMSAFNTDPDSVVYLFATSQNYVRNGDKRIEYLTAKEIENFVKAHKELLPQLTRFSLEFCGYFD